MKGNMCRLYDEQLVRNIMIATGLTILEHITEKGVPGAKDICEFIEMHAETIIEDTITDMNSLDEGAEEDALGDSDDEEDDEWLGDSDSAAV
ncbi:MAG: hypothetical protein ACLFSB_14600 [Chitinispirillaceae bacterium]